jgi:hypothetical protein
MDIPKELTGKELFKFLVENKEDILYAKKNGFKKADSITCNTPHLENFATKELIDYEEDKTSIKVRAIINTTNVVDSHKDVHLNGIWNKSISENRNIKFLQEHQMSFKSIIADKEDLDVSVNSVTWKSLGFDFEGKTEALTFDAVVKQKRNNEMFREYMDKNVDNHSVGMRYVKLALAINSEDEEYKEEKEVWDKVYPLVANKVELEKSNYFWAVSEAKVIEGSAVVMGSNGFTPTVDVKSETIVSDEQKEIEAIKEWLKPLRNG